MLNDEKGGGEHAHINEASDQALTRSQESFQNSDDQNYGLIILVGTPSNVIAKDNFD